MIPAELQSKQTVSGLVDVIGLGISKGRLEDAEHVLAALRALRPRVAEFDTFEAWIATRRGYWRDAVRILRAMDAVVNDFSLGKALMAFCQYAMGDLAWRGTAERVMELDNNPEAMALVRLLLDPDSAMSDKAQEPSTTTAERPAATRTATDMPQGSYLRG